MHDERTCVVPEKFHTPQWKIIRNSEGEGGGGVQRQKFPRGGGGGGVQRQ